MKKEHKCNIEGDGKQMRGRERREIKQNSRQGAREKRKYRDDKRKNGGKRRKCNDSGIYDDKNAKGILESRGEIRLY